MSRSQLQEAQTLLKQERYDEAYDMLRQIDHPMAKKWMQKIEEIDTEDQFDSTEESATEMLNRLTRRKPKRSSGSTYITTYNPNNSYSSARLVANIYRVIGYLVMVVGVIAGAIALFDSFFTALFVLLGAAVSSVSFIAIGELILVFIELADNGREQIKLLKRIANQLSL